MYLKTTLATDWGHPQNEGALTGLLRRFLPEANPGYRDKMHLIAVWYVEFDVQGQPYREIGADDRGQPFVAGPSLTDYGFWLDTNMTLEDVDGEEISKLEFETLWDKAGVAD